MKKMFKITTMASIVIIALRTAKEKKKLQKYVLIKKSKKK